MAPSTRFGHGRQPAQSAVDWQDGLHARHTRWRRRASARTDGGVWSHSALPVAFPNPVKPAGLTDHRTFSVARPIKARISEMIQNRMTICGSAQPFFS